MAGVIVERGAEPGVKLAPGLQTVARRLRATARRLAHDPFTWVLVAWLAVSGWWLRTNRWSGYFELDEAAYAGMALRLGEARRPRAIGLILANEGNHGPLQSILAFPPQLILGPDPRWLLIQNVLLAAVTAAFACATVRRLATPWAGTVAGALVLLAPGVIEHSRLALTSMPATCFAMMAVYGMVRARGVEDVRWSVLTGVAIGSMTLGRSMAVGFVPACAVMGVGWVISRRTSPWVVVRGAAVVAGSAVLTAAWWWYLRWSDVSSYLFGGGSTDTEKNVDVLAKFERHVTELGQFTGYLVPVVGLGLAVALWSRGAPRHRTRRIVDVALGAAAGVAVLLLGRWTSRTVDDLPLGSVLPVAVLVGAAWSLWAARRAAGVDATAATDEDDLTLWPIWAGVLVGVAVLARSTAYGVGFVLPLVPWSIVAGVSGVRRGVHGRAWRGWVVAVLASGAFLAATVPGRGLDAGLTWCGPNEPRAYCGITTNAEGIAWRTVSDRIADRVLVAVWAAEAAGVDQPRLALTGRDMTVNGNTVSLAMQWRHHRVVDPWGFLRGGGPSVEEQLAELREGADVVVVVPDAYEAVHLAQGSPTPDEVLDTVRTAGFRACDEIPTPQGLTVQVLVSPRMPESACRPLSSG